MQVSIIIVNYNVKYFLEHCLYSVQAAVKSIDAEIIVVDNASSDGSMEYLLEKFPSVNFIDNPRNVGFAKANNQALLEASGEYILFLNPDTILPEDCLTRCMQVFQSNPRVGACGVKMIDGNGEFLPESKRGFPTVGASFYKLSGLAGLFPRSKRFAKYQLGHLPPDRNNEIDVLSGAFFMTKAEVLNKTGGFDERFFMYGEDIDLSYRIQKEGYINYYFAETCIIHFKGESTKKGNLNYLKLFYKAMDLFVEKHFSKKSLITLKIGISASMWIRAGLSFTNSLLVEKKTASVVGIRDTFIIAVDGEIAKIESLLNDQKKERKITKLTPADNWREAILLEVPDEIIFAYGSLSYKEIIASMQALPKHIIFGIYSGKAKHILGSSSRNGSGNIFG